MSVSSNKRLRHFVHATSFLGTASAIILSALTHSSYANDAPDPELQIAIEAAADKAIGQIENSGQKVRLWMSLAKTEIRMGDLATARMAMAEVRSQDQPSSFFTETADIFVLSVRAGDTLSATEFIQRSPPTTQAYAFGKLATTQIDAGDGSGAEKALALLDALKAKNPPEAPTPPASSPPQPQQATLQMSCDSAFRDAAKSYAIKGDIPRAQTLLPKISSTGWRWAALAEIAKQNLS